MKKKVLTTFSIVLILGLAALGILAYLSDSDSDVNVMTLGNVQIEQIEQERVNDTDKQTELKPFSSKWDAEEKMALFPAVYPGDSTLDSIPWAPESEWVKAGEQAWKVVADNDNVVDKFVTVKNTGKSPAYVRTLIAYEGDATYGPEGPWIHVVTNGSNVEPAIDISGPVYIEVDGVVYTVYGYTYTEALASGAESIPSLKQVYMDHMADNDVVAKYGDEYNILVLSQAIQKEGFGDANTALNTGFASITKENKSTIEGWFTGVLDGTEADTWDGTVDASWYNDTDTEFTLMTSEQLAGLAELVDDGNTFAGKTIKLEKDIDLYVEDENGEAIPFDPIGSYRFEKSFMGTFDGQGHTIANLNQNTWALDNGYYYNDCGLGLFGAVEEGTVKDLTIDGASILGESAICGAVAAVAHNATFENITIKESDVADYQYYSGGIVGWASGETNYIGCNLDASTTVATQWGDFDNSTGGVIGGASGSAEIFMKDCTVACRIDAYNDVTSTYQWYAYRRCGMLIGNSGKTEVKDGTTYASAPQLTCENVTVIYDDWANYTYCEFAGTSWPYVRVQAGVSNSAYSNPRYGHPTDANGNEVTNDTHVHNADEDHFIECTFDQLYGGGQGVYGTATHEGVTVVYNNK